MQIDSSSYAILLVLKDRESRSVEEIASVAGISPDAVRRALTEMETNHWVKVQRQKQEAWSPTKTGKESIAKKGLPEMQLLEFILPGAKEMPAVQNHFSNPQEFSVAFGLAKRSNWIAITKHNDKTAIEITPLGKKALSNSPVFHLLLAIARGEIPPENSPIVLELKARGLIESKSHSTETVTITQKGLETLQIAKPISTNKISQLTPEIIVSGKWKNAQFKPYDVQIPVEETFPGRLHPLTHTIRDVRKIMVELGFNEYSGPLVESVFWNNEVMFFPQDHPSRDAQDTFYIPGKGIISDTELAKRVKAIHEHGGKTGSRGHGYEWNPSIAQQLLLRTHTTAATYREFGKGVTAPHKGFSIGRIFRNEAIDATHLAEFHQVEGFVMGEGLTLRHLMGIVKEFYGKLGLKEIRFKPTYNPYTEPSMEASAYNPKLGKWVELINSGMFRPETLAPFGIKVPVIAWGFGLERLAMFLHDKHSTKEVIGPEVDLDFIRNYNETIHAWESE